MMQILEMLLFATAVLALVYFRTIREAVRQTLILWQSIRKEFRTQNNVVPVPQRKAQLENTSIEG